MGIKLLLSLQLRGSGFIGLSTSFSRRCWNLFVFLWVREKAFIYLLGFWYLLVFVQVLCKGNFEHKTHEILHVLYLFCELITIKRLSYCLKAQIRKHIRFVLSHWKLTLILLAPLRLHFLEFQFVQRCHRRPIILER